jgi:hypothetical protein
VSKELTHLFGKTGVGIDGYIEADEGQISISFTYPMLPDIAFNYLKASYELSHKKLTSADVAQSDSTDDGDYVYTLYLGNKPIFSFRKNNETYTIQPHEGTSLEGLMNVITGA